MALHSPAARVSRSLAEIPRTGPEARFILCNCGEPEHHGERWMDVCRL